MCLLVSPLERHSASHKFYSQWIQGESLHSSAYVWVHGLFRRPHCVSILVLLNNPAEIPHLSFCPEIFYIYETTLRFRDEDGYAPTERKKVYSLCPCAQLVRLGWTGQYHNLVYILCWHIGHDPSMYSWYISMPWSCRCDEHRLKRLLSISLPWARTKVSLFSQNCENCVSCFDLLVTRCIHSCTCLKILWYKFLKYVTGCSQRIWWILHRMCKAWLSYFSLKFT